MGRNTLRYRPGNNISYKIVSLAKTQISFRSVLSNKSSQGTLWVAKDPMRLQEDSKSPGQLDLSLLFVYMQSCMKCSAEAYVPFETKEGSA